MLTNAIVSREYIIINPSLYSYIHGDNHGENEMQALFMLIVFG